MTQIPKESFARWLPPVIIAAAAVLAAAGFLLSTDAGIPMGDAYIHFSYARNLALHGELSYNLGAQEGIGSTSFLWVLLLAAGQRAGILPETAAVVLGTIFLAWSGTLVYTIAKTYLTDMPANRRTLVASAAGLLTVFPGSLVWLALSGMEAALFLCLALLAIRAYGLRRWALLGLVLGLLALTRIEGLILAGTIGLVEVIHQRRIPKGLVLSAVIAAVLLLPWLLFLYDRGGLVVTASFQGRKVMVAETNTRISQNPVLASLISLNPVVYLFCWAAFLLLYASGAAGMPGPVLSTEQAILGTQISLPALGGLASAACLVLLFVGFRYLWRQRGALSIQNPGHLPVIVLAVWAVLHNLAYGLFISQIGAAGRYAVINQILFWVVVFIGAGSLEKKSLRAGAAIFAAGLLAASLFYWQRVYAANIAYSQQARIAAAEYIDSELPAEALIGATDLGPIQYFARQPVVDLIGHVNQEVGPFRQAGGDFGDYLQAKEICYLMLFTSLGEAGIDFAEEMGFRSDPRFELVTEARFAVPEDTWRLGSEPLRNYLPAVEVFRVDWQSSSLCEIYADANQVDEQ